MKAIHQLLTDHIDIWTAADTEKKSGRGRSSGNAANVYGIKKLRELILELAVRGKLVPQDANDEPASELLKRILFEKAKLIKNGTIKNQKIQPPITEDEKSFEIPDSWEWVRLDNISPMSLVDGDWIESKDQDPDGDIRLVQLADIGVGEFKDKSDRFINSETFEKLNCTQLQIGDILIARLPSPIGRACLFPDSNQIAITVVDVAILRPLGMFCDEYVVNAINSKAFRDQVETFGKGATRFRIATGNLKSLLIPIPPIEEQHRIVAKVDELMALCDQLDAQHSNSAEAHEKLVSHLLGALTQSQSAEDFSANWQRIAAHFDTLFITEVSIDALKQTLLQMAIMGKLVPQDANDESASELLKRIQAEKAKLIAEGKIKKDKPLPPITDDEKPFELPIEWVWVRLGSITEIKGGKRVSNGYKLLTQPTPYIYIRVSDMKNGSIDDSDLHYIDSEMREKISRYIITKDDIYMTIVGATIGKCGIVPEKFDQMNLTENAARLTPWEGSEKLFLYICLEGSVCQSQFFDKTKQVGVQKMALNRLASTIIPLPPTAEQHRIIAKVDELMAICDQLKSSITKANQLQQKLADVMVEQAVN